jgi:PAS domain S-box-containing protein
MMQTIISLGASLQASLSSHGVHSFVDLTFGILLLGSSAVAFVAAFGKVRTPHVFAASLMWWLGVALFLAGIEEVSLSRIPPSDKEPFGFVEYVTTAILFVSVFGALPWMILRARAARRTIEHLQEEVQSTEEIARRVKAEQYALSERYAERSTALERTTDEAYRFAALVRNSQDAIIGLNNDGTIWHWNPAAEELLKRRSEDVIGRSLEMVKVGNSGNLWKEALRILAFPFLRGQSEISLLSGDGAVVPVWLSVSVLPEHSRGGAGLAIFLRNMTEKKVVEEKISASLVEKEALLKEVHHRVKNNLQLICSLLRLQAKEAADTNALTLFRKSEERIRSLALVHEKLYRSESLSTINFGSYVSDLVGQLARSAGSSNAPIDVEYFIDDVHLPIDPAITCGLILNELVTNSIKHGGSEGDPIKLRVTLARSDVGISFAVWDNGKTPVSPGVLDQSTSLGLSLVRTLTRQLGGSVAVHQNGGVEFSVQLPLAVLKAKDGAGHRATAY